MLILQKFSFCPLFSHGPKGLCFVVWKILLLLYICSTNNNVVCSGANKWNASSHKIWEGKGEAVGLCPYISACLISCWSRTSSKLQGVFCAVEFSPQIYSPGQNHRGSFALLGTIPPFNMDIGAEVLRSFIYYSLKGEFLFSAFEGFLPRLWKHQNL